MWQIVALVILICVVLAIVSVLRSVLAGVIEGNRRLRIIHEHDAAEEAKSFEQRAAERGMSDLAIRHPDAIRQMLATPNERQMMDNQIAKQNLPPNDPTFAWTDFWEFARLHGITDRKEMNQALGYSSSGLSPSQCRDALRQAFSVRET